MNTTIILQGKDAKMWSMMKALEALGAFDIKYGSICVNFDGEGRISNVKVEKNYRPSTMEELTFNT